MVTYFQQKVYSLCEQIPKGKVSTYGELARALNSSPRAVGQALKCNPFAPKVPCHRVVSADGRIGGFMGQMKGKAIEKKIVLLKSEGVIVSSDGILDLRLVHWF